MGPAVWDQVYNFINGLKYKQNVKLPSIIADEFVFCGLLLPLARADLRLDIDTTLVATDATPTWGGRGGGGGACDAKIPGILADDLYWCAAQHNGEHVRFDLEFQSVFRPSRMNPMNEELEHLVESLAWRDLGGYGFKRTEHINIQELEALRNELKRLVNQRGIVRTRRVVLVDSRVVVGAWAKGRSSSVLGKCKLVLIWVNTHINPADDVSRFVRLRNSKPLPPWSLPFFKRDRAGDLVQYSLGELEGDVCRTLCRMCRVGTAMI